MKNFILSIFSFFVFENVNSQAIQWQNTIGGSSADVPSSIQITTDGGFILGCMSNSNISGDKIESSNGDYDFWVIKIDFVGNIQWQNTIGGSLRDILTSVQQTDDGGYILGGYSDSNLSGDKIENSNGNNDYWILKIDGAGNIQWQNTIGGSDKDQLYSIEQTIDGGYILGGISMSNISGDKTENCYGTEDIWIVKVSSSGTIQWQNTIGGSGGDYLYELQQTLDGGYILGGNSSSNISGDKSENSHGMHDYWVLKVDSTGSIQWQNTIGGSWEDQLNSLVQTLDGGYILEGISNSNISGDKTENSNGDMDSWVVKIDSAGSIQWQNTIGGSRVDQLYSIKQTSDGKYVLSGTSNSYISGDKSENTNGGFDTWVIKIDSLGSIIWQNSIGGFNTDEARSIVQSTDGSYLLCGYSESNISGDKTEDCMGISDIWIVKIIEKFNSISGRLFIDLNSNSIQETSEPVLAYHKSNELNTDNFVFSKNQGDYYFAVPDSGNYTVSTSPLIHYSVVPTQQQVHFIGINQTDSLNDFAFQPAGTFNDLKISITPIAVFRPGFDAMYRIDYRNVGTTSLAPTIVFTPASDLSYLSASVSPTLITTDSVLWNLPVIGPFDEGHILVTVNVSPSAIIGSYVTSITRVEPVSGDATPVNNEAGWEIQIRGSFDPNDILVNRSSVFTTELISPPFIEYVIRFQNTGSDTAFTVKVLNPIDTSKLDLGSLEFISSSHPVDIRYISHEKNMEFKFNNILLADSNTNEPASHGFVRYQVKPKTSLAAGDTIKNYAAIYFDFNSPVITNTANTLILLPTKISNSHADAYSISVFPNPVSDKLHLNLSSIKTKKVHIRILDIHGSVLQVTNVKAGAESLDLDISLWVSGIYFLEIITEDQIKRAKFLKQ
jgi:hypothetical protein